jgi:flagellar basal-body rod protein FlgC
VTEFSALSASAAGMEAQRAALDVDARNVAAAETGAEFDRLVPRFAVASPEDAPGGSAFSEGRPATEARERSIESAISGRSEPASQTAFEPGAPFIRFTGTSIERGTGVDAITEMVAVLNAQRAFEADASVFEAGKRLAERTIDVGRA